MSPHLLTVQEASGDVGVTPRTIVQWLKAGLVKGAFELPGKSGWRIPRKRWEQFKRERTPREARLTAADEKEATDE